jgi:PPOX class probable F420-dependent enzyme
MLRSHDDAQGSLPALERELVESCRTATLATVAPDGRPRLVPICFALDEPGRMLYTPLDEKPKRGADPRELARVRDIRARPRVTILFERYAEDWRELAWVRVQGSAALLEPTDDPATHRWVVAALRSRYEPYRRQALERAALITVTIEAVTSWSAGGSLQGS